MKPEFAYLIGLVVGAYVFYEIQKIVRDFKIKKNAQHDKCERVNENGRGQKELRGIDKVKSGLEKIKRSRP